MTSKVYISEYSGLAMGSQPMALEPELARQVVDYSGGAAQSTAFDNATTFVRVHTDSICSIKFGANPTATTSDKRMSAGQTEYFGIQGARALKISAITNT